MLSALLGAVSAALLAFAPALVEPSSNLSNNDGDITSLCGAYYDGDLAGEYGTTEQYFYNYSTTTLKKGYSEETLVENEYCEYDLGGHGYVVWYIYNQSPTEEQKNEFYNTHDLYINGVLYEENDYLENGYGPSGLFLNGIIFNGGYVWLFDHYEEPYTLGNDTVADIAEGLTSGIGTVATGIGGGLGSLMQNIFLVGTVDDETGAFTATGLSTFGIVTVVFCGLALALALSRWVVGFASSLGSRNR